MRYNIINNNSILRTTLLSFPYDNFIRGFLVLESNISISDLEFTLMSERQFSKTLFAMTGLQKVDTSLYSIFEIKSKISITNKMMDSFLISS